MNRAEHLSLTRLSEICLAFPETMQTVAGSHASFTVRKRTFAYYLNDHHGDGKIAVASKALPGDNAVLAQSQPHRFFLPAYLAPKGWIALRLDVGPVDWDEVRDLVLSSYGQIAPKRLVASLESL